MENNDIMKQAQDLGIDTNAYRKWAAKVEKTVPDYDFVDAHDAFDAGVSPHAYARYVRNRRLTAQGR